VQIRKEIWIMSHTDTTATLGGSFTFPGTGLTVNRMGYGAMQLAGPHVWGEPRDRAQCIAVLREVIESGVNHIDTSDFYGPHVTNQIIKEALHPYTDDLVIVSKLGARRGADGSWQPAFSKEDLITGTHENLRNLGLDAIDIVNYRNMGLEGPNEGSIAPQVTVLAELKQQGLIRHIGLSNVTPEQLQEAQKITDIVCIQNLYNVAKRDDDGFIDDLTRQGIAYVPFFPLGGFTPLQSSELNDAAAELGVTPMQLALAWLLHRAPNMLLIPGTSTLAHLRENLKAATIVIPAEILGRLNALGTPAE
jgi:pyridoxine 4-dehydrogenase